MTQTVRRVRKFQIRKGDESYRELDHLCDLTRNMYNKTLYTLRQLYFASTLKGGQPAQYYLNNLDPEFRPYVVSEIKTIKAEDGTEKTYTNYSLKVPFDSDPSKFHQYERAFYAIFERSGNADFRALPSDPARSAVLLAVKAHKAYILAHADWEKNHKKYIAEPKLPYYKKLDFHRVPYCFNHVCVDKKSRCIKLNKKSILNFVRIDNDEHVQQVRIVPKTTQDCLVVEVIYKKEIDIEPKGVNTAATDIGINNLMSIVVTNENNHIFDSLLINGRPLKSINQFYNKKNAEIKSVYAANNIKAGKKSKTLNRKRENKIDTYLHQATRLAVNWLSERNVKTVFIGKNNGWKQRVKMGRRNNQSFVSIPFNKMIQQLAYKCQECGIQLIEHEEAYTSKCSALDNEKVCKHETYLGKRTGKHNKAFFTKDKILVNADINGAFNILRLGTGMDYTFEKSAILTPPKFHKVGMSKKMQYQNHACEYASDMVDEIPLTENHRKLEATVDSQNGEIHSKTTSRLENLQDRLAG